MADENDVLTIKDGGVIDCKKDAVNVVIPEGVTKIGRCAFAHCKSLKSVVIPSSVTEIRSAFADSIVSIEFGGTVAQWNAIEKWSKPNVSVKCTDGVVTPQN